MKVKLVVAEGTRAGTAIPVKGSKFLIGRAEDCHLRPASDQVSRHHCVLLIEPGYVAIRDFGSRNGTFVNEELVVGETELKAEDILKIGPLTFAISIEQTLGGSKRPHVEDMGEVASRTASGPRTSESSVDLDVASWLETDDDVAASETQEIRSSGDTAKIRFDPAEFTQPEATSDDVPGLAPEDGESDEQANPNKPASENSTVAAQQTINQLLREHRQQRKSPDKIPPDK